MRIETNSSPVSFRLRRLAPDKLNIAKQEFQRLANHGAIRTSNSNWFSPLHMLPKQDSFSRRPYDDYRRLNCSWSLPNFKHSGIYKPFMWRNNLLEK